MRPLCDEMLCGLGRWLRAAGHDKAIAQNGVGDRDLLARAVRERRTLLTRDRHLAAIAPSGVRMVLIETQELDEQARELREALGLDWLFAPFTRCMMDNSVLLAAGPHHITWSASRGHCAISNRICVHVPLAAGFTGPAAMSGG